MMDFRSLWVTLQNALNLPAASAWDKLISIHTIVLHTVGYFWNLAVQNSLSKITKYQIHDKDESLGNPCDIYIYIYPNKNNDLFLLVEKRTLYSMHGLWIILESEGLCFESQYVYFGKYMISNC